MTSIEHIKLVLQNLSCLGGKYDFIEDSDLMFLNDYFKQFRIIFILQEILEENDAINYEYRIDNELLDTLTSSVRKVTKKSREAAKLMHILKKSHFKALFTCLKELNNNEHIPITYDGDLHEIEFETGKNGLLTDEGQLSTESDELQDSDRSFVTSESEVSENIIHDNISLPKYQDVRHSKINKQFSSGSDFQIIGVQRDFKQSLGITVVKTPLLYEGHTINRCVIERILVNSLIDKQGLMQVGDIIFEVNDDPVETPDELQSILSKCKGTISFKILKSSRRQMSVSANLERTYVRALFNYDPSKDKLLPSEQIGLPFKAGDVFEVLNRDDANFWQAVPLNSINYQACLIPSQSLQERIIALQKDMKPKSNENITGKGKRKKSRKNEIFRAKDAADIVSEADLQTYEEVVRFGPSRVPCVLLIGPTGIGKKAIKHCLVQKEPHRFSFPLQDTSEAKRSRNQPLFNHVDRNIMVSDIKSSLYVCLEEKSGELYGIKSSGIRELINQGKTVVLDCQPKEVYSLKTPLFNPFVILIASPVLSVLEAMQKEGLQRNLTKNKRSAAELQDIIDQSEEFENTYKHLINAVVSNDNIQHTASRISALVSEFENNVSWIPASWEFDITPLPIQKSSTTVNKPILKHNDSGLVTGTGSTQRRYEKKNVKPSSGLSTPVVNTGSNKVVIAANPNVSTNSLSDHDDQSDDSNSESNHLVMAKPIKYSSNINHHKKPEEVTVKVEEKPIIKHSIVRKNEEVPTKRDDKSDKKHFISKSSDEIIIPTKKEESKHSKRNSKSNEEIPLKKEDKTVRYSTSKSVEEIPTKTEDKPPGKQHSILKNNSNNTKDITMKKDEKSNLKHMSLKKSEETPSNKNEEQHTGKYFSLRKGGDDHHQSTKVEDKKRDRNITVTDGGGGSGGTELAKRSSQHNENVRHSNIVVGGGHNNERSPPQIALKPKGGIGSGGHNIVKSSTSINPNKASDNVVINQRGDSLKRNQPISNNAQRLSMKNDKAHGVDNRRVNIQRKDNNSSSEMSDTSSDSDMVLKENRV